MNIFLDTNVFWKDPFLTKGKKAILLRLAKHDDVNIYINETVYQELFRGHKTFLEREFKSLSDSFNIIKPFLNSSRDQFFCEIELQNLFNDFHNHFSELANEKQLTCISYDSDVLKHLVDVDVYSKAPFIKKQEIVDKEGKKTTFNKKEIRDAIIWYSYKLFIQKNNLEDCYFITNNVKDYGASGAKNGPKESPFPLHPDICNGVNITAYKTVHDFLAHKDQQVKEFFKEESFHLKVLSEDFFDQIEDELKNGLAEELINKFFEAQIHEQTVNFISEMEPVNIHDDYFMGGYIEPSMSFDFANISFREVDIYGDTIAIAVDVEVNIDVNIYLYNPVHDSREDKYEFANTDTVKVEESIVFLISIDTDKNLVTENFSFKEYIEGLEPDNLNIEFIGYKTIDHISLFGDDEEYEPTEEEPVNGPLLVEKNNYNF